MSRSPGTCFHELWDISAVHLSIAFPPLPVSSEILHSHPVLLSAAVALSCLVMLLRCCILGSEGFISLCPVIVSVLKGKLWVGSLWGPSESFFKELYCVLNWAPVRCFCLLQRDLAV